MFFINCLEQLHCKPAELHLLACHVHLSQYNNSQNNSMVELLTELFQKKYSNMYSQEWSNILRCKEHHMEEQEYG